MVLPSAALSASSATTQLLPSYFNILLATAPDVLTSERLLRLLTKVGVPIKSLYEPLIATVARVGLFFIKSNDVELL